ncbi:hypothetical protein M8C21_026866 [Ambrosia artemisiifolia]|uniref:peroxidase n=1 Tax=Ambrosia artemisiifolia TaxID=4212 RepID=A0AAD5DB06_AMBAR|nr:hypothetical protein M8C21_026866 [Ambrosia artemisiifolia]
MKMSSFFITIIVISLSTMVFADDYSSMALKVPTLKDLSAIGDDLSYSFYHERCHDVEGIIYRKVKEWVYKDPSLAPSLLRLQYHDCVVRGLNVLDLVVLSGAHTIGRATCESVQHRLYDYKGTNRPDPSLDPKYLNYLRRKCRWASENVHLDGETPDTFDTQYYHNLKKNLGLLSTDQLLYSDSRTKPIATGLSFESSLFKNQFGVSMVKLSSILDYTSQDDGEIRVDCKYVNH